MIRLVSGLLERGVAYRAEDGSVYFSIARFPAYGRLARLDAESLRTGGSERVLADDDAKESARDFVLWKAVRPERFGVKELDIHSGGVDLIFPHHEDEIAQACAWTGQEVFARYWVHGEFLNVRGEKMSKRFGNTTTVRDLREDGWGPAEIRYLMTQAHYRQKLDLTDDALAAARAATRRLGEFTARLQGTPGGTHAGLRAAAETLQETVRTAMDDDLDAPRAMGAVFDFLREANRLLDAGAAPGPEVRDTWAGAMALFDVLPEETATANLRVALGPQATLGEDGEAAHTEVVPDDPAALTAWAEYWGLRRLKAKGSRDYAEADRIRDLLLAAGFEIRDRKDGQVELVRRS
jgi:cysteinyl-tRNA synthetase